MTKMVTYCHRDDPLVRFLQYASDSLPCWAQDVQEELSSEIAETDEALPDAALARAAAEWN